MKNLLDIVSGLFKLKIILFVFMNLSVSFISAQNFERVYGGQFGDDPEIIVPAFDGGYLIAGSTINSSASPNNSVDILLVKTDSLGYMQWSETIKSTKDDEVRWFERSANNTYLLCGNSYDNVANELNIFVIRLNLTGTIIDQKIYRINNGERSNCIRKVNDGGSVIAGETTLSGSDLQMYLLKLDSTGIVQWSKAYGDTEQESAVYVRQTTDNGFILAGNSRYGLYWSSIYIVKTDTAGNVQWSKKYNTPQFLSRCDVTRVLDTKDGGYIISGSTNANQPLKYILLMKINSTGNIEWQYIYGTGGGEKNSDILSDENGYAVCGSTANTSGYDDLLLMKTDTSGNLLWQLAYGVPDSNIIARSMIKSAEGRFMIAAYNDAYGAGETDFMLLKSDSVYDGSMCNMKVPLLDRDSVTLVGVNSPYSSVVNTLSVNGSFVVASGVQESLVCNQVLKINEPEQSVSIGIIPNPNSGEAIIKINCMESSGVSLIIYDIFGRKIVSYKDENISNKHEFSFNADNLLEKNIKPGVYFCIVSAGKKLFTEKLIISQN